MAGVWSQIASAQHVQALEGSTLCREGGRLYLDPLAGAGVLCADEKFGVQALDPTQPLLPMTFDKTEKRTHDYVKHSTINLFGAGVPPR